jgi:sigma-B regulation protein RsbU (phosphoserine phosphatase)
MDPDKSTLLVVDDNETNRNNLSQLLRLHRYEVVGSQNGQEALKLLQRQPFDLVLLDIMMAGLSGLEVLKELRTRHPATELPVIMTTARSGSEDIIQALRLGANDYITKPIDVPVLVARIQTHLSLRHAVQRVLRLEEHLSQRNEELSAANSKLKVANAQMKEDLRAAARIQEAFLPPPTPRLPRVHSAWLFHPCAQLAGDMLNVFVLDEDHLGVYVLDVCGHGVASALLSVTLSHFLSPRPGPSSLLFQGETDGGSRVPAPPAEMIQRLNERFPWDPVTEQFFTLVYGILNVRTGELRYASAGHPGMAYLASQESPELLQWPSLPVGVGSDAYEEHRLLLAPRDRFYLYSDGLVEVVNGSREVFGVERLLETLDQVRDLPLQKGLEELWRKVEQWCAGAPRRDDVSLLAVEFCGS